MGLGTRLENVLQIRLLILPDLRNRTPTPTTTTSPLPPASPLDAFDRVAAGFRSQRRGSAAMLLRLPHRPWGDSAHVSS